MSALIAEIGDRRRAFAGVAHEVAAIKKKWLEEWEDQLRSDEMPINQYRVIYELSQTLPAMDVIITHESGGPREQLFPFWESLQPHSYLGWGKTTQLGHSLGLIMGAKIANPDKLCVNVMGDASVGMVGLDIETAVRHRLGILTIVLNNGVMAGERSSMPKAIAAHDALDLGGNYADMARAMGAWSQRVTRPDDIAGALIEAMRITNDQRPALIEMMVQENTKFSRY